jgi:predicted double-glycine peptidase
MVMQYWVREQPGLDAAATDAESIHRKLPPSSKGIHGSALKRYLEQHGFDAFIFDGELADLRNHTGRGRPLIVCLGLSGAGGPLHYVVVTSINASEVIVNDPARGKLLREDLDDFKRAWKVTDNWAMLAVPRQQK